ncbi:hypothetical protein CCR75_001006 [Bremia lactucae]|uniref:Uncharacterized protein n=1 Tax=Bremia lactucae TaxID=4779 RepID=A0A976NY31_BRELC|nr:hypothetical protein CCR75_001006 [Bremia lactucae]
MWMQNSAGGGNLHDRNRFGSNYAQNSYSGGGSYDAGSGDWKSKILESGQWLGGKVIEYGGKLARGSSTNSIPDHFGQQMPRNDGRANWMADIRSNTSSFSGGYNASAGGYQNDFASERPKTYSDYGQGYSSNPPGGYESKSISLTDQRKSRHVNKTKNERKSKSNKIKTKPRSQSESSSLSESEDKSLSESSESSNDRRRARKKKSKAKKHKFYSESESDDHREATPKMDYAYSFDPAKLPPPPQDEGKTTTRTSKTKSKKKDKREKTTATTRVKAKKRSGKKSVEATIESVDLLGVDLIPQATSSEKSVFLDDSGSHTPLEDLAGLSFTASASAFVPTQASTLEKPSIQSDTSSPLPDTFVSNVLPENNLVDLNCLASEKKKALSAHPIEKRTLNDLKKAQSMEHSTPVLVMPMPSMQPHLMVNGMVQYSTNFNQLPLAPEGSNSMYSSLQPQVARTVQPQMMILPRVQPLVQGQQSLQGQMTTASTYKSLDPFPTS